MSNRPPRHAQPTDDPTEFYDDTDPRQTGVTVSLVGRDGNAFGILGTVMGAMRSAGIDKAIIDQYHADATSGDYDHLLRTTMAYVVVI